MFRCGVVLDGRTHEAVLEVRALGEQGEAPTTMTLAEVTDDDVWEAMREVTLAALVWLESRHVPLPRRKFQKTDDWQRHRDDEATLIRAIRRIPAKPPETPRPRATDSRAGVTHCSQCAAPFDVNQVPKKPTEGCEECRLRVDLHRKAVSVREHMSRNATLYEEKEKYARALGEIGALASRCEECDPGEAPVATHVTSHPLSGIPIFLCSPCAEVTRAQYRKAESKGCGRRPEVLEHEEEDAVEIALRALGERPAPSSSHEGSESAP